MSMLRPHALARYIAVSASLSTSWWLGVWVPNKVAPMLGVLWCSTVPSRYGSFRLASILCPTMCAFGGADLRTLYVTTARQQRDDAELARLPQTGGIFAMRVDVPGLPEPKFAG